MIQLGAAPENILNSIKDFFQLVFVEFSDLWFWPIILIGLMVLAVIVLILLVVFSYENRILKSINKINSYFLSKPFITEENLVEFNLKMKKVPRVLRNNWQIYMLNREDSPTTYINVSTCIDKPLRTSSIEKNIGNYSIFSIFIVFLAFIVGLQYSKSVLALTNAADIFFFALLVPLALVFVYTIFMLIIKAIKNDIYSCLYDNFPLYERNLTKAVSTLPAYVDYEILFTKKEIKEGIPILQQYLEKRALVEQQELEKARANSIAVEEYDFSELGIDGSLVLERSMKECETFIRTRRRLQEECDQIEAEKENYKKNFEITSKDYQRKLQASRENLESLKSQQEASTNRIESNYIRKQQSDEIKKQQQLEKDNEEATAKFNEEQISLQQEIERRKQEIEDKKSFVEQAMLLEFKHYANELYKALANKAAETANQKLVSCSQENADLKAFLADIQGLDSSQAQTENILIQPEEVASNAIYEMSNSEESQMKERRKESKKLDKEEAEKERKQKEALKAKQQAEMEVPPETEGIDQSANQGQKSIDGFNDIESDGNENSTDDEGQIQQNYSQADEKPVESDEEINQIQKQIEEENDRLIKQKQEFQNELNNTISKINENTEEEPQKDTEPELEEEPEIKEKPEIKEEPKIEEKPVVEENQIKKEPEAKKESAKKYREPKEKQAPSRRNLRKPVGRQKVVRNTTSRVRTGRKSNSEIDALNAEMQKLLDSTKK